jgi:hypothetical protein
MKSQPKPSSSQDGPLKVDRPFDDAIARALTVKPPAGGWVAYEASLKQANAKKKAKRAS